jgi:hypothetical protein
MAGAATVRNSNRRAGAEWLARQEAAGWRYADNYTPPGRLPLGVGRRFRVRGERGWFRFRGHTTNPAGDQWVEAYGPHGEFRSVRPERITRVERALL